MYVKPLLEPHVTGYAIARRGRGTTNATAGQSVEDEMEDVAALHFNVQRHLISRRTLRNLRSQAFAGWREVTAA